MTAYELVLSACLCIGFVWIVIGAGILAAWMEAKK